MIAALIDCMKRGIPMPDSAAARTMEPPSALRGSAAGKHARCINLDEVCILDPAMSRKILMAFRTRDYGDVLRVFNHSCKFKTVRRILLPLNISWEGITLGTGCHWVLAELHLDTSTTHLYDWFKKTKASTKSWHVWQLATPQSSALLRMFAYATLLRTHAVYCLQHPCRPSSSCCTSAVV